MYHAKDLGLDVVGVSGGQELILCPFHHDTKPSAWFSPRKGLFWCSVCHIGLNVSQLAKRLHIDIGKIVPSLDDERESEFAGFDLYERPFVMPPGFGLSYAPYYEERGISPRVATAYGLQWNPTDDIVAFPITDMDGQIIGTQERFVKSGPFGRRYMKFGKTTPVWPMHFLPNLETKECVIITEGGWSAMRIAQVLDIPALSFLGARAPHNAKTLLSPFKSVVVLYDNDRAGIDAARRMKKICPSWQVFVTPVSPDDLQDADLAREMAEVLSCLR